MFDGYRISAPRRRTKFDIIRTMPRALPSLVATLTWGAMFPIAAATLHHVDPYHLTAIRYGLAVPVFLVLLAAVEGRAALRPEGRSLELFVLGSVGFAGFNLLGYVGIEHTRPQEASLVAALMPLLTVLATWGLTRRAPGRATLTGIAIAFAGVALVITRGDPSQALHGGGLSGDAMILVGALGWVAYTLGARRFPGFSPLRYTALSATGGSLTILAITGVLTASGTEPLPTRHALGAAWLELVYVVAFAAVLAVLAWNEGVRRLGAPNASLFMNLVPIVAFAIAVARGYHPAGIEIVGGLITVAALVGVNLAGRQAIRLPSSSAWAATRLAKLAKSRA
jgi:drug/metabolite transporter (DMT)-like permease